MKAILFPGLRVIAYRTDPGFVAALFFRAQAAVSRFALRLC
jgi:hypothetical protein